MNNPNPYHSWLIRQRIYCEHSGCMDRLNNATEVVNVNGQDLVYCLEHAGRLADVRKSERKQDEHTTQTQTN